MNFKKIVNVVAAVGMIVSSPVGLLSSSKLPVVAAEQEVVNSSQDTRFDFENNLGHVAVNFPKSVMKSEEFQASIDYDWGSPDTINVLQVEMLLNENEEVIFTGAEGMSKSDYSLSGDGKRLSVVLDDGKIKEGISAILMSETEGTVNVTLNISYVNINDDGDIVENNYTQNVSIQVLDAQALEDAKTAGKEEISALENLSDFEKDIYIGHVDEAKNIEEISLRVLEATEKNVQNLQDKKNEGEILINGLEFLSQSERDILHADIENGTTVAQIAATMETASKQNLNSAKVTGQSTINQLQDLSDPDKKEFISRLNKSTTVQEVMVIVEEAKAYKSYTFTDFISIIPTTPERVLVSKEESPIETTFDLEFEWTDSTVFNMLDMTFVMPEGQDGTFTGVKELSADYYVISDGGKTIRVIIDEELEGISLELSLVEEGNITIQTHATYGNNELNSELTQELTLSTSIKAVLKGDLDEDGQINIIDLAMLKEYNTSGTIANSNDREVFLFAADINNDGSISVADYALLKRIVNSNK